MYYTVCYVFTSNCAISFCCIYCMLWFKTHSLVCEHGLMELQTLFCVLYTHGHALRTVWSLLNHYLSETGYLQYWAGNHTENTSCQTASFKNFLPLIFNQPFLSHPCILSWQSLTESSCLPTLRYHPYDISLAPNSSAYPAFLSVSLLLWHFLHLATFGIISIAVQKSLQLYAQFNCAIQITWYLPHITK